MNDGRLEGKITKMEFKIMSLLVSNDFISFKAWASYWFYQYFHHNPLPSTSAPPTSFTLIPSCAIMVVGVSLQLMVNIDTFFSQEFPPANIPLLCIFISLVLSIESNYPLKHSHPHRPKTT